MRVLGEPCHLKDALVKYNWPIFFLWGHIGSTWWHGIAYSKLHNEINFDNHSPNKTYNQKNSTNDLNQITQSDTMPGEIWELQKCLAPSLSTEI